MHPYFHTDAKSPRNTRNSWSWSLSWPWLFNDRSACWPYIWFVKLFISSSNLGSMLTHLLWNAYIYMAAIKNYQDFSLSVCLFWSDWPCWNNRGLKGEKITFLAFFANCELPPDLQEVNVSISLNFNYMNMNYSKNKVFFLVSWNH